MKVLEVCMSKGFGGLELYVMKIAILLGQHGHDYSVFTRKNSFLFNELSNINVYGGTVLSVFHHFPLFSAIKLAKYINSQKIDVLHAHWGKDILFIVLAKILSKRKIKIVYTRHMALTRKKDDFYHRFIYRNIDAYHVITKELYLDAIKYIPIEKHKIQLLYHGVSVAANNNVCESYLEESMLVKELFRLVIFGRIEKGKGQHLVVEAVNKLKEQGINIQLSIIGHIMDQIYYEGLKKYIKNYNLEGHVFYLGFHNSPTSIMPCFDAVILATKCETFGLVLPEAMRAGVAVIGSNCGGVPEIITHEETGLLFKTEDVDDLVIQLLKIVNDKGYCEWLAKAGKKDADERFSEEKHFKKLVNIFESA